MNAIQHFMWGYQRYFAVGLESNAKRLFQTLDSRLEPEAFLVGIQGEADQDRFPACVEPEDDFWITSEEFNNVFPLSDTLRERYPETELRHSHSLAQQAHDERLLKRSIQDAIKQIIESHPSKPVHMNFVTTFPVKVDCYWVCIILGLQQHVVNTHYSLQKSSVELHEYRRIPVPTSLIDAAIAEFLERSTQELLKPDPGSDLFTLDTEELLRSAGRRLMSGVVLRTDWSCAVGTEQLFSACNSISSLRYEQSAATGSLLLAKEEHSAVTKTIRFSSSHALTNHRASRKLLELASDDLCLHSNSEAIFGLADVGKYESEMEDLFKVRVLGNHLWELSHADCPLMRVHYGLPSLPHPSFDEQKLRHDLPRIFTGIAPEEIGKLVSLIRKAEKEPHGTMLVITEDAENEAKRLNLQGIPVHPCPLEPHLLRHLTPIDGAVILSPEGVCYGIGTVLDGKATDKGDPARGARYNSAVRYVEATAAPCLAVVVSEDGGIDFVPNLKPAIRRSEVDRAISALQALLTTTEISRREYRSLMDWLSEHRFYLRQEDCDILNTVEHMIEDRLQAQSDSSLRLIGQPFIPHPDMDESLYYMTE